MIRERNQTLKIGMISLDFLLSCIAFTAAVILNFTILSTGKRVLPDTGGIFAPGRYFGESEVGIIAGTYSYLGILFSFTQILVFIGIDLYHPRRGLSFIKESMAIVRGLGLNLLVVLALLFFYRGTSFSRMVIVLTLLFSLLLHPLGHLLVRKWLGQLREKGYRNRRVLILGTGHSAWRILDVLRRHSIYGYRVVGVLGPKSGANPELKELVVGGVRDLKKAAGLHKPDMILYAMHPEHEILPRVLDFCDQEGLDCRIVPELADLITHMARIEDMEGIPILTIRDVPLNNGYNRFLKRIFDIMFSFAVILLLSPVYILLTILVKLDSPGPVFFVQERVGLDRKFFRLIKFRTMRVQQKEHSDTIWGSRHDARVTLLGRILRKTSLDELPQFFNVLMGDMSVVGPRPERPHFVNQFKSQYYHYMRRHSVKSGITGWAQIQGFRGDTSIQKRVDLDIYYVENWSFLFDLIIVAKTIPALLKSPGE